MNVKSITLVAGVCATLVSFGGNLVVSEPTTLSATADYDNAEIHADLSIDTQASVAITGSVVSVGSEAGEKPVITISEKASLLTQHLKPGGNGGDASHWLWPACTIGANGGTAKFVVSDSAGNSHTGDQRPTTGLGLWLGGVTVSPNAAVNNAADDTIDLLELNAGAWADIAALSNFNAKTVRVLFNGGSLRLHYAGTRGTTYYAPSGKTVELRSVDGNDIWLKKSYLSICLINGGGTLRTSGDGNVILWEDGYTEGSNKIIQNLYGSSYGTIAWEHKGNLRLRHGGILRLLADDTLPYGAKTGIVELVPSSEAVFPEIDLYGHTAKVNGLVTTGSSFVSNRTATAAALVFGDSDYVGGRLSARIFGNVTVVKNGAGSLAVTNTVAPALTVASGTVTVGGTDSAIGAVTVASGASLVVDGAVLTCQALEAPAGAVQCRNGGTVVLKVGAEEQTRLWNEFSSDVTSIEKTGSGECVYYGTNALSSPLKVDAGRFTFSGRGYVTNEWWRWTVTASFGGSVVEIGELCFFDPSMAGTSRMNNPSFYEYNVSPQASATTILRGTDATTMPNSSVMVLDGASYDWKTDGSGRVYGAPTGLFDRNGVNLMFSPTMALPKDQTAEYPITVRLAAGKVVGYFSYVNSTYGLYQMPKGWRLETSPDGATWTTAATYYDSTVTPTEDMLSVNGFARAGKVFTFEQLTMPKASGISPSALVSVASGATLDLDYTPDANAAIGALEYDLAAGGGTITKFIPAETGNLNLVGAKPAYGDLTLSYTFGTVKNAANLVNWTVSLNGEAKDNYHAEIVDGELVVHVMRKGLVLQMK